MRLKIEELLNVNCFDIYGLCEITGPGVALECIHHKGMHIYEDYFYPEVLNPADHTPCADGETGELVFTTLVKEGSRYFVTEQRILQVLIILRVSVEERFLEFPSSKAVQMI